MFTGLVQDVGSILSIARGPMTRIAIATALDASQFELGESIALDGACHTVLNRARDRFEVESSPETLRRTTVGDWIAGTRVNLERALRLSDRLGGHMVLGHVDAVARILARRTEGGALVVEIELPEPLAPLVIEKGSIAVDGISLTVNTVAADRFSLSLIPETQQRTTLSQKTPGQRVNLETDVIGKYVARLMQRGGRGGPAVDEDLLRRCGFL